MFAKILTVSIVANKVSGFWRLFKIQSSVLLFFFRLCLSDAFNEKQAISEALKSNENATKTKITAIIKESPIVNGSNWMFQIPD